MHILTRDRMKISGCSKKNKKMNEYQLPNGTKMQIYLPGFFQSPQTHNPMQSDHHITHAIHPALGFYRDKRKLFFSISKFRFDEL